MDCTEGSLYRKSVSVFTPLPHFTRIMKLTALLLLGSYDGLFELLMVFLAMILVFIVNLITSILHLVAASKGSVSKGLKVTNGIFSLLSVCSICALIALWQSFGVMVSLPALIPLVLTIIALVKEDKTNSSNA